MQYHALALAACGMTVDLIGYQGILPQPLLDRPGVHCRWLRLPRTGSRLSRTRVGSLIAGGVRAVEQALSLLRALLFVVDRPAIILVQSPPAIPTLFVALIAARLRSARLVIDWHNLTYTLLALPFGGTHSVVRFTEWYERTLARRADAHLCVSRAMQRMLAERWGVQAWAVYDRAPEMFKSMAPADREDMVRRVCVRVGFDAPARPAIIVSPMSWSLDDDVELLLEAVSECEDRAAQYEAATNREFPPLLIILTGQGPTRQQYSDRIQMLTPRKVWVRTLWMPPDDYPRLLGSADLGLSLHRSSSGLDLPMKVADMFGSGLPVCALDYGACLAEVLRDGDNGLLFATGRELAQHLVTLFQGFPHDIVRLERLRQGAVQSSRLRWQEGWLQEAWPVLSRYV